MNKKVKYTALYYYEGEQIYEQTIEGSNLANVENIAHNTAESLGTYRDGEVKFELDKVKPEGARKARCTTGCEQKLMTFRIDNDNVTLLQEVANKGRLINNLLHDYFKAKNNPEGMDAPEELNDLYDQQP